MPAAAPAQIGFVGPSRLGDAVLSSGLLAHLVETYQGARFTVVTGPLGASLYRAVPGIRRILVVEKKSFARHWLSVYAQLASVHWDVFVDMRRVPLLRLVRARAAHVWAPSTGIEHKVIENARLLGQSPLPPKVWLDETAHAAANTALGAAEPGAPPILALGATAGSRVKQWPEDRFLALAERLTAPDGPIAGAKIAVFGAHSERGRIEHLLKALPQDRLIDAVGGLDPLGVAAALSRARLFIGNDSGLMHLAAATGTPTLGLFGTGDARVYGPWGQHTAYVEKRLPDAERLKWERAEPRHLRSKVMEAISVGDVEAAATDLLNRTHRA